MIRGILLSAAFLLPALGGARSPAGLGRPEVRQLLKELHLGPYTVRLWEEGEAANRYSLVVIERDGKPVFKRTGSLSLGHEMGHPPVPGIMMVIPRLSQRGLSR